MYKDDLALNNLKWLRCQKTKPNQTNDRFANLMAIAGEVHNSLLYTDIQMLRMF